MYADNAVIYLSDTSPGLIKQVLQSDLKYVAVVTREQACTYSE